MLTIFKFGLFGLSTLGTFQLIRKISNDKIDVYFLPSLTIAIQTTILFFAGILNLLPEMSTMLYLLGLLGIVTSLRENKGPKFAKDYFNDGYIILIFIMCIMAISVRGKLFSHYDNFSHWALVVRYMLEVNHYPNFQSSLIAFQEYPLGSSTYIYYFAKMIGTSESVQMLAQLYMIVAAVLPLFSFVGKRSIKIDCIFVAFINFVLIYNIRVGDLLVDTLLPVVGICSLLFAKKYCTNVISNLNFMFLSCYLVQIIQIKNSGVFFVLVTIIACFSYHWKSERNFTNMYSALFPFISLVLWHKHCEYVFLKAAVSKHAMTFEKFQSVFGKKTAEDINVIVSSWFKLSTTNTNIWMLFGFLVLIGCFIWFFGKNYWPEFKKSFVFSVILYICYQIGMLGMYLFSMPSGEATRLASSIRYLKTIILAILMLNMVLAIRTISDCSMKKNIKTTATVMIIVSFFSFSFISKGSIMLAPTTISNSNVRTWIERNRNEYSIPMNNSYCILIPKDDRGYSYHLLKYTFNTKNVSARVVNNVDVLNSISSKYIFVYDNENEIINTWIKKKYPNQFGNDVIISNKKGKVIISNRKGKKK